MQMSQEEEKHSPGLSTITDPSLGGGMEKASTSPIAILVDLLELFAENASKQSRRNHAFYLCMPSIEAYGQLMHDFVLLSRARFMPTAAEPGAPPTLKRGYSNTNSRLEVTGTGCMGQQALIGSLCDSLYSATKQDLLKVTMCMESRATLLDTLTKLKLPPGVDSDEVRETVERNLPAILREFDRDVVETVLKDSFLLELRCPALSQFSDLKRHLNMVQKLVHVFDETSEHSLAVLLRLCHLKAIAAKSIAVNVDESQGTHSQELLAERAAERALYRRWNAKEISDRADWIEGCLEYGVASFFLTTELARMMPVCIAWYRKLSILSPCQLRRACDEEKASEILDKDNKRHLAELYNYWNPEGRNTRRKPESEQGRLACLSCKLATGYLHRSPELRVRKKTNHGSAADTDAAEVPPAVDDADDAVVEEARQRERQIMMMAHRALRAAGPGGAGAAAAMAAGAAAARGGGGGEAGHLHLQGDAWDRDRHARREDRRTLRGLLPHMHMVGGAGLHLRADEWALRPPRGLVMGGGPGLGPAGIHSDEEDEWEDYAMLTSHYMPLGLMQRWRVATPLGQAAVQPGPSNLGLDDVDVVDVDGAPDQKDSKSSTAAAAACSSSAVRSGSSSSSSSSSGSSTSASSSAATRAPLARSGFPIVEPPLPSTTFDCPICGHTLPSQAQLVEHVQVCAIAMFGQ